MKRAEIDAKIDALQKMLAVETDCSTMATINRCLERLIMMDADDEEEDIHQGRELLVKQ